MKFRSTHSQIPSEKRSRSVSLLAVTLFAISCGHLEAEEHSQFGDWKVYGGRFCILSYSGWNYDFDAGVMADTVGYQASVTIAPNLLGISFERERIGFYGDKARKLKISNGTDTSEFWIGLALGYPSHLNLSQGEDDYFGTELELGYQTEFLRFLASGDFMEVTLPNGKIASFEHEGLDEALENYFKSCDWY